MHLAKSTAASTCPTCSAAALTRNHYFTGKLMVERDFTDEQHYFRERLRLHNQRLHGEGVACGLRIRQHDNLDCQSRYVVLEPGSAIDCCGQDILVIDEDTIDLHCFPAVQALFDKPDDQDHVLQFRICYRECPTEEIPVLYDECGCDDSQCAPNRILESYAIDVKVDPTTDPAVVQAPQLKRQGTVGIARSIGVVLDEAGARLFVLSGGTTSAVYQISSSSQAVETSFSLGRAALAMAISPDATRLYLVVASATAGSDGELWIFDTSGPTTLAGGAIDKAPIAGSGTGTPVLAMASTGELLAAYATGAVYAWKASDAAASPSEKITVSAKPTGIACASNGKKAWLASLGSDTLTVLDLTVAGLGPTTLQVTGTDLFTLATVVSTGPDLLVAGDQANSKLHLIDPAKASGAAPIGSVALADKPVAVVAAPGGAWAYVDEASDALQIVDLGRLQAQLPTAPTTPFGVGPKTDGIVITASGLRLYVPYFGAASDGSDGGVAVIDIEDTDCGRPLHEVRPCPDCGRADCLVLATVRGYRPGRRLLDPADPAPSAADDAANGIARIDNLDGRKILASTSTLQEVIECLLDHGGGGTPGPQGPVGPAGATGATGATGPAGPGLDVGVTRITALSWKHGDPGAQFVAVKRATGATAHGIVIGFSHPVLIAGDTGNSEIDVRNHRYVLEVEVPETTVDKTGFACRCPIGGLLMPVTPTFDPGDPTLIANAQEAAFPATAVAFVVNAAVFRKLIAPGTDVFVRLRGEFVVDVNGNAVDAEFVRATLPTGDRRLASGSALPPADADKLLSVQGGRFESWFTTENVT